MNTVDRRRLVVSKTTTISALPGGWPAQLRNHDESFVVNPAVTCEPGRVYTVLVDVETSTATITEASDESR